MRKGTDGQSTDSQFPKTGMIIILDVNLVSEKSFTVNTNSFELCSIIFYSIISESDSLSKLVTANILINRIYHRSPIQTEKFNPEDKWKMPETRFTAFPALSVDPRLGFLSLHF